MVRARTLVAIGLVGSIGWCAGGRDAPPPRLAAAPQLAVRAEGFLAIDGAAGAQRIAELDRTGRVQRELRLAHAHESRAVGTRVGTAVVWRDGHRVTVAQVRGDGALGQPHHFGKRAQRLCDGAGSNDQQWGVGWVEGDGSVWVVFGPTSDRRDLAAVAATAPAAATARLPSWCTVASTGDEHVLLWRENADVVRMVPCTKKGCSPHQPWLPKPLAREDILAAACQRDGCAFATRDARGAAKLSWVDRKGRAGWSTPLAARAGSPASLIAAGDRQLAVAYIAGDGHVAVARVDGKGALTELARDPAPAASAPSLSWSQGQLLVAGRRDGRLATEVIALPR